MLKLQLRWNIEKCLRTYCKYEHCTNIILYPHTVVSVSDVIEKCLFANTYMLYRWTNNTQCTCFINKLKKSNRKGYQCLQIYSCSEIETNKTVKYFIMMPYKTMHNQNYDMFTIWRCYVCHVITCLIYY